LELVREDIKEQLTFREDLRKENAKRVLSGATTAKTATRMAASVLAAGAYVQQAGKVGQGGMRWVWLATALLGMLAHVGIGGFANQVHHIPSFKDPVKLQMEGGLFPVDREMLKREWILAATGMIVL
jgi:hypothetical protein